MFLGNVGWRLHGKWLSGIFLILSFQEECPRKWNLYYRLIEPYLALVSMTQPKLDPPYQGLRGDSETGTTSLVMSEMSHLFIASLPPNGLSYVSPILIVSLLFSYFLLFLFSFSFCRFWAFLYFQTPWFQTASSSAVSQLQSLFQFWQGTLYCTFCRLDCQFFQK